MEPVAQALGIGSQKQEKPVAPPPTRDDAAIALAATQAEEQKRRGWSTNSSASNQLTPVGGVSSDMTGTRMLSSGS